MRKEALRWAWLGRTQYRDAMTLMEHLAARVASGGEGCIIFLEHPPTITLGKRASQKALLASPDRLAGMGIAVEKTDRGGEATYHGPGQLVCYPVLSLKKLKLGIESYVSALLDSVRDCMDDWGVNGAVVKMDRPGVWTPEGKITAVGLRVKEGIATHGFAVNLDVDKSHFETIVPCGIEGARVANVSDFAPPPKMPEASRQLAAKLETRLGCHLCAGETTPRRGLDGIYRDPKVAPTSSI